MSFVQMTVAIIAMFGYTSTVTYGQRAGREGVIQNVPQPYNFGYQIRDVQGNVQYRNEQRDQNDIIKGSYGYTDIQGLYRHVDYIADIEGFRANIQTNEPGTQGGKNPSNVILNVQRTPAGIQPRLAADLQVLISNQRATFQPPVLRSKSFDRHKPPFQIYAAAKPRMFLDVPGKILT